MSSQSDTILTALHYLFSHSEGRIVAHCLDLDLVTSGNTIESAEERLNAIVLAQIAICYTGGNYAQLRFKAPAESWQMLSTARELPKLNLEVDVPPVVLPVKRSVALLPVYRHEVEMELQVA
ncbi:MAG TPA: hypothetical protein VMX16_05455 [Terriglobia bacterium]|nr:hypothetical protein [Terriglobia bacterium]